MPTMGELRRKEGKKEKKERKKEKKRCGCWCHGLLMFFGYCCPCSDSSLHHWPWPSSPMRLSLPQCLLFWKPLMLRLHYISVWLSAPKYCLLCSAWARNKYQPWPLVMFPEETCPTFTTTQGKGFGATQTRLGNLVAESPLASSVTTESFPFHSFCTMDMPSCLVECLLAYRRQNHRWRLRNDSHCGFLCSLVPL